jgi:hypothetical protein
MTRRLLISLVVILALSGAACDVSAQNDVTAVIPLDMTAPRPTAQLRIGDAAPVTAIFDTGAAASVLRLEYARRIDSPEQGQAAAHGPGGTPIQGFRTTMRDGVLGDAAFDDAMAVALDIPLPLPGVDAIISPGVFSGRYVRFDFPHGVAHVLPRTAQHRPVGEGTPYTGESTHGRVMSVPGVDVHLPNVGEITAILDTGSARGLLLPLDLAERLPLSGELTPIDPVRMVGIEHAAFSGRINGVVRIGELSINNPEVRFADGVEQAIVGMEILRNADVVLDPEMRRAWVFAPRD